MIRRIIFSVSNQRLSWVFNFGFIIFTCVLIKPDIGFGQQTCNNCTNEVINNTIKVDLSQNPFNGKGESSFWYGLVPGWQAAFNTPHSIKYDPLSIPVLCDYTYNYADGSEINCLATKGNGYSEGIYTDSKIQFNPDGYETYCVRMKVKKLHCINDIFPYVVDIRLTSGIIYVYDYSIVYNLPYVNEIIHSELMDDNVTRDINITFNTINDNMTFDQLMINTRALNPEGSQGVKGSFTNVDSVHISCSTNAMDTIFHEKLQENYKYRFSYHYPIDATSIEELIWDFGDGYTSNEINPEHQYSSAGIYQVCADYITENYCCGRWCDTIHVSCNEFEADFLIENNCPDFKLVPYQLSNELLYEWFVNNNLVSSNDIYHASLLTDGQYIITLKVTNNCGENKIISKTIDVDCNRIPCDQNNGCINIGNPGGTILLSSLLAGSNPVIPHTTFLFNSKQIKDLCFNLEGILVIDVMQVTFLNTTWYCGSGSAIRVLDGGILGSLNFIDSELQGCSTMWRGIEADGNGIPYYYYWTGYISLVNTTISDAYRAVEVSSGRSINAIESRFYNNYVGIYITPTNTHNQIFTNIENTTFEFTGMMLPQYFGQPEWAERSFAGIETNDLIRLSVKGSETNSKSLFRNLSYGVYSSRSGLDIIYTTFERSDYMFGSPSIINRTIGIYEKVPKYTSNIEYNKFQGALFTGINSTGGRNNATWITNNLFNIGSESSNRNGTGIIYQTSTNNSFIVGNNEFELKSSSLAIQANTSKFNQFMIDRNLFNIKNTSHSPIVYIDNCNSSNGNGFLRENIFNGINSAGFLHLTNSKKFVLLKNECLQQGIMISQANAPESFIKENRSYAAATIPLFIQSRFSPDSKYCCNSSESSFQNTLSFYGGGDMNQKLIGNTIKTLELRNSTIIGKQDSHGNIFPYNSTARADSNDNDYYIRNQFNVDNSATGTPTNVIPVPFKLIWFRPGGMSATCTSKDDCDSEAFELPPIGEDTSWYFLQLEMTEEDAIDLVSNYIGSASLFADTTWSNRDLHIWNQNVRLYTYMQKNPNLNWSQIFNSTGAGIYFNENLTPEMIQWAKVEQSIDSLYQMSYQEVKLLHDYHHFMREVYRQLRTENDSLNILNLYQELNEVNAQIDSMDVEVAYRTNISISDVATEIDALNTPFLFLTERKTVWKTYIKRMQYGLASVTTGEWDELRRIASLCPLEYGSAVYESIGLLTLHDGIEALDLLNEDCTPEVEERRGKMKVNKSKIYPNPSNGTIHITYDGMEVDQIMIMDILGQIRYDGHIEAQTSETMLNLSNLPAGLYHYELFYRKGLKDTGKFLLID